MGTVTQLPLQAGSPPLRAPEALADHHHLAAFHCDRPDLDDWLKHRARNSEDKTARTFVVCEGNRVVAYYCLAAGSVARGDLPKKFQRNAPDPIPVIVVGRLGVDIAYRRIGLGSGLLRDAMTRAMTISQMVGVRGVLVHAIDQESKRFYQHFGFLECPVSERTLLLPLETIRAGLAA